MLPKLKPFERDLRVFPGDSVGLVCIAKEGDTPISFLWTKDGFPASSLLGVDIGQSNMYSSLLGISDAASGHTGIYSCTASNAVGLASTSVQLQVEGNVLELQFDEVIHKCYFKESYSLKSAAVKTSAKA